MIYFIYGRNNLLEQKSIEEIVKKINPSEKIEINLEELTPAEFAGKVTTPNIFGYKNVFLIEIGDTTDKDFNKALENVKELPKEIHLIFKTTKTYRKDSKILKSIRELKNTKVIRLEEKKDFTIFNFLDAVYSKDKKKSYRLLGELEKKEEPAFKIHSMFLYQLRNVAKVKFGANFQAASFIKDKIKKQAGGFTEKQISELYEYFYKTDRNIKLGLIPENVLNILNIEEVTGK